MSQSDQLALIETVAVHCFFGCRHVVLGDTTEAAHDAMEAHYREKHVAQVARIVGSLR